MFGSLFRRQNETEWILAPKTYLRNAKENHTGKILLPQNCLQDLVSKQIEMPYTFKITAHKGVSYTHAGVHEFTAEVGEIVLPKWMHEQLALDRGAVEVTCTSFPKGQFIRLAPQSKSFLDIENPKASLEGALRNYQVLSEGDTISLYFEEEFRSIMFTVTEIRPKGEGISIIDTDLEVDFLPPADYEVGRVEEGDSLISELDHGICIKDKYFGDKVGLGVVFLESEK